MPFDRSLYPENWEEIARAVKEEAGWKCEVCLLPHGPGFILTVHHLDGNRQNSSRENLKALCQKCHLSWQGSGRRIAYFNDSQLKIF